MGTLTIRQLNERTHARLRERAASHGRSVEAEVRAILGTNAAELYDFDLAKLAPLVAEIGPTVEEVATPLDKVPEGGLKCPAFDDWQKLQAV